MSKFEIELKVADASDLNIILNIVNDAAVWLHSIGVNNQWTPGEVFNNSRSYMASIRKKSFTWPSARVKL